MLVGVMVSFLFIQRLCRHQDDIVQLMPRFDGITVVLLFALDQSENRAYLGTPCVSPFLTGEDASVNWPSPLPMRCLSAVDVIRTL